jgi:hypothetical protein
MAVRAKAYVASLTRRAWNEGGVEVEFAAATKGDENKAWALATPSLTFKLTIKNPIAADVFDLALGKEFYIDITPAE